MGARFEAAQLAVGANEAFLHDVFGILLVAGHPVGQLKGPPAVLFDQHAEGLAVSLPRFGEHGGRVAHVHSHELRRPRYGAVRFQGFQGSSGSRGARFGG